MAVVDGGILVDLANPRFSHPDFAGRVLPGYDFVSSVARSGDGDGRDPDPYDHRGGASSHGTHVADTIAAATDSGTGVAGVDWQARLVPVRVLGVGGSGFRLDVIEEGMWGAGFSRAMLDGVPTTASTPSGQRPT